MAFSIELELAIFPELYGAISAGPEQLPAAMHHLCGSSAPFRRWRCTIIRGQAALLGRHMQVGDYLIPNLILPEQQDQPIGVWGQRHARYLKQHHKIIYMNLLTRGKLNGYLVDIENQAENMFIQIVKQLAESENITEELKAKNPMLWCSQLNNIRERATKIVNAEIIYV